MKIEVVKFVLDVVEDVFFEFFFVGEEFFYGKGVDKDMGFIFDDIFDDVCDMLSSVVNFVVVVGVGKKYGIFYEIVVMVFVVD